MTSRVRRFAATLTVLPMAVALLGFGLASPALADTGTSSSGEGAESGDTLPGLKVIDLGDAGRATAGTVGNIF
jgi:hypothetical protein